MKLVKSGPTVGGPSSSIGIMQIFESDSGIKISPKFVVGASIVVSLGLVFLKFLKVLG